MKTKLNLSNTSNDCDLDILDFQIPWLHIKNEVPLICPICGQSYQSNADLNLHSKIHYIIQCETYGKCEFCQKWYKIEGFESQNIHKEFYCLAKLKTSSKQLRLVEKWTLNHKYKLSSTKIQLTFKVDENVDVNRYYSTFLQPAKCEKCGKVFSKKGHLDRHVRTIHMGMKDESEPCPHCGKIFTTKSSLEPHIEAVHKGMFDFIQIENRGFQ